VAGRRWSPGAPGELYRAGQKLRRGRFLVRGVHGVGGMSVVYRAERRAGWWQREPVALKVARPREDTPDARARAEQRLAREAMFLGVVRHWRIPRPLEVFSEHGSTHLAMQFVPGWTLERLLVDGQSRARAPWPEDRVVGLGSALAQLLSVLHAGQVPLIVRDLKPVNLIVTPEGHVKLIDLGIASRLRRGQPVPPSERWLGTRGYAAPEQCRGDGWEDERVDLFALGAVLYRAATGWDPARQADPFSFPPARHLNPAVSRHLEWLLAALLSLDPDGRPPNAAAVAQELASWSTSISA
jgi:eukaryotic-like serine/threonine-protein kinase